MGCSFIWCGRQDSNLHALALEPKSNESTNSTTPAYEAVGVIRLLFYFTLSCLRNQGELANVHQDDITTPESPNSETTTRGHL